MRSFENGTIISRAPILVSGSANRGRGQDAELLPENGAGRYFIDKGHTATLHVLSYTNLMVGEVTLRLGVDPALHGAELHVAESQWFKPLDGFGNWHALHLGSSKNDVLKNLGEPKKRVAPNDWRYETVCQCELPEYFDIFFKDDGIVKVVFSAPAG